MEPYYWTFPLGNHDEQRWRKWSEGVKVSIILQTTYINHPQSQIKHSEMQAEELDIFEMLV